MFSEHIGRIYKQGGKKSNSLGRMSDMLSTEEKLTLVRSFILCHFKFCPTPGSYSLDLLWCDGYKKERENTRALRFVYGTFNSTYQDLKEERNQGWPCSM